MLDLEAALQQRGKTPYRGQELTQEEREQKRIDPYRPSPELRYAVNLAILLENRPLLLKGEPGSGKTRLAEAVANELALEFEPWYIKSTTRAKDGLYRYDAVRRLQDAQLAGSQEPTVREQASTRLATSELFEEYHKDEQGKETGNAYLQYGPLGKAFTSERQTVVLIDEIDKADIDFPNDLLRELAEAVLRIEEIGKEKKATNRPLIFITSNDEKDLPDAFLRRCLFHYIDFPKTTELEEIVKLHRSTSREDTNSGEALIKAAVTRFCKLRNEMGKDKGKKISTAELLDWYAVLACEPDEKKAIEELNPNNKKTIPYPEVLLKRLEDWRLLD
jgi:MoxR-like ATPase